MAGARIGISFSPLHQRQRFRQLPISEVVDAALPSTARGRTGDLDSFTLQAREVAEHGSFRSPSGLRQLWERGASGECPEQRQGCVAVDSHAVAASSSSSSSRETSSNCSPTSKKAWSKLRSS